MTIPHDPTPPTPRRQRRDDDDQAALSRLDTAKPGAGELDEVDDDSNASPLLGFVIQAPAKVSVILPCPTCGETSTVVASLFARVTKDSDGKGAIALRTRAAKVEHVCGQMPLGLAEGPRVR